MTEALAASFEGGSDMVILGEKNQCVKEKVESKSRKGGREHGRVCKGGLAGGGVGWRSAKSERAIAFKRQNTSTSNMVSVVNTAYRRRQRILVEVDVARNAPLILAESRSRRKPGRLLANFSRHCGTASFLLAIAGPMPTELFHSIPRQRDGQLDSGYRT